MSRAAARPSVRLIAAVLHAACVLFGPGVHLWEAGGCGCGHAHVSRPKPQGPTCGHGLCRHHGHRASDSGDEGEAGHGEQPPSKAPAPHDPDECHVCRLLALARVAAPAVRLTTVAFDAPLVVRPLPPPRPVLVADAVLCRGPPAAVAGV